MKTILKYKRLLIIAGVIAVAFVLYSVYLKPDNTQEGVVSNAPSSQQTRAGQEILALLVDLREIELNGELFRSDVFRSLEDFSIPIAPEPQGRPNPFAPIGEDRQVTSQNTEGNGGGVTEGEGGTGN